MKILCILILFISHSASVVAQELNTATNIQDERTYWEYREKLNDEMNIPAFKVDYLAFRIENDYGTLDEPEFYLVALLGDAKYRERIGGVFIKYPEGKSIYNQLNDALLANPNAKIGEHYFNAKVIHKRISYKVCPAAVPLILEVEEYLKNTKVPDWERYENKDKKYTIGLGKFIIERTYETRYKDFPPVSKLLEVKDILLDCAINIPTVVEQARLDEEKRRSEYKGKIYTSPPNIVLKHEEDEQISAVGSYCWPIDTRMICSDSWSWPSPNVAAKIKKGDKIGFEYPESDKVNHMEYQLRKVSDEDMPEGIKSTDKIYWNVPVENVIEMKSDELNSLVIDVEPGLYLLTLFGWWQGIGDATHGFLIEVE